AAKQLPFRNFAADVSIGRFYLREVEITNLQTTAKIDGGHVLLNPFTLALNGAPVNANADLDLGIPGYKYDVSFNTKAVPLAPLVNSFDPEQKGRLGGTFTAQAKASGTGRVDLQAASVQSPAFRADAKGTITLAPVLTNSTLAVPVSISLAQAVAERVGLAAAGTAGGYAKIPDFYTMKGTIGDPKND